jgi:hypothetical protein
MVRITPARESGDSAGVGGTRVPIADVGGKELDEAPNGIASGTGKQCGHAPRSGLKGPADMVMICEESIKISIA